MAKQKLKWWVYLLHCADGTLYTGVTTDTARRLDQHNAGRASRYTRSRRPVALAYREPATSHGAALQRELAIKKLTRTAKEMLIARKQKPDTLRTARPGAPFEALRRKAQLAKNPPGERTGRAAVH